MSRLIHGGLFLLAFGVSACSPSLDWRVVQLERSGLQAWMPCRPDRFERDVQVGGRRWPARLQSCEADGLQFGLMEIQADEVAQAADLAGALVAAARANLGADRVVASTNWPPAASRLDAGSGRWRMQGVGSDGRPRVMETALLLHGAHVVQATVLGVALTPLQTEPFFENVAARVP